MPLDVFRHDKCSLRVVHTGQLQALGRCCHAKGKAAHGFISLGEGVDCAATKADFNQRAGDDAHHVVQEGIAFYSQDDFVAMLDQISLGDGADGIFLVVAAAGNRACR